MESQKTNASTSIYRCEALSKWILQLKDRDAVRMQMHKLQYEMVPKLS